MKNLEPSFSALIQQIISNELDEIQQEQFAIEGEEIIQSLFTHSAMPVYSGGNALDVDFGIAPSNMKLQTTSVNFINLIQSCFSLLKEIHHKKSAQNTTGFMEPVYWSAFFSESKVSQSLIDLLCGQYKNQLTNLFALL